MPPVSALWYVNSSVGISDWVALSLTGILTAGVTRGKHGAKVTWRQQSLVNFQLLLAWILRPDLYRDFWRRYVGLVGCKYIAVMPRVDCLVDNVIFQHTPPTLTAAPMLTDPRLRASFLHSKHLRKLVSDCTCGRFWSRNNSVWFAWQEPQCLDPQEDQSNIAVVSFLSHK